MVRGCVVVVGTRFWNMRVDKIFWARGKLGRGNKRERRKGRKGEKGKEKGEGKGEHEFCRACFLDDQDIVNYNTYAVLNLLTFDCYFE